MKIDTELDQDEVQVLFDLLNNEIVKHGIGAKLERMDGKMTEDELKWHLSHSEFLMGLKKKLGL